MVDLFRAHFPFPLARKPGSPHPSALFFPTTRVTTDPGPLTHAAALVVKMAAPCVYCSKQQGRILRRIPSSAILFKVLIRILDSHFVRLLCVNGHSMLNWCIINKLIDDVSFRQRNIEIFSMIILYNVHENSFKVKVRFIFLFLLSAT